MKVGVGFSRLAMAAGLACAAVPVSAQDTMLTPQEIRSAWEGKKVFGRSTTGGLLDLHLRADGTADVAVGNMVDSGTWRLNATGYCATWKRIRAGEERCFTVVRRGATTYVLNPDRSVSTEVLRVTE